MNPLEKELERYLTIRRGFGFDLNTSARILRRFITFANGHGMDHITTDLFLRWKSEFGHAGNGTWSARLGIVRFFAQ